MSGKQPIVREVLLSRKYAFMYENFVLATQTATYLLLEQNEGVIYALRFNSPSCRYGGPNDEAHDGHPLTQYGLGMYGLYYVENSPWVHEMMCANRVHPRHNDALFDGRKHFIACFKDVKFESVCTVAEEITLSREDLVSLIGDQLDLLQA